VPTCKKCGYQNREGIEYCVNCGAKLEPLKEIDAKPSSKPTITTNQAIVISVVVIVVIAIFLVPMLLRSATPKIQTVIVRISYSGEWQGSIGDIGGSYSVQGYGYKEYTFHREGQDMWIVTAVIQKMETYGVLTVSIITSDGKVLESQSTSAEYGIATVSWSG